MNSNKRLLNNTIILYVRLVITSVVGLFVSRFVLQALGFSDYGLYNVVAGIVVLMAFLNTVMISTTYRYIAFELGKGNSGNVNSIFNFSLVIHICLAILLVFFAETIGRWYVVHKLNIVPSRLEDALFVFRMAILSTLFVILSVPFQGLITAKENFKTRASIEVIKSILSLGCALLLLRFGKDKLILYSQLMVIIGFIPSLLFFIYCKKYYSKVVRWSFQRRKEGYKEMLSFSGWIMFGAGASVGQIQGSTLLINNFFNTVLNASFGIAIQVFTLLKMFSGNLSQAVVPQITKNYSSGNNRRTEDLVCYTNKYGFFLLLTVAFPILIETEYLLNLWLGSIPSYTVVFCQLMVLKALLESLSDGLSSYVQASGKIRLFQIVLSSLMILAIPISYFGYSIGSEPYIILVIFLCMGCINTFLRLILMKRILNFNVKKFVSLSYFRIIYVSFFILPLFVLKQFFDASFLRFLGLSFTFYIILLFSVYTVGLESFERKAINRKLSRSLTLTKKISY